MPIIDVGDAAPGWPTSGAARRADGWVMTSRNLPALQVVVTAADGSMTRQVDLGRGDGAWGVAVDGPVTYLAAHGTAEAANLLAVEDGRRRPLARLATAIIWDLTVVAGEVVGVGTGPALRFAWSATSRRARDLGLPRGVEPRTCVALGPGLVVGGARGGQAVLLARDHLAAADTEVLPASLAAHDGVYCSAAAHDQRVVIGTTGPGRHGPAVAVLDPTAPGDAEVVVLADEALVDTVCPEPAGADPAGAGTVWATARPSGGLYRIADGTAHLVAIPVPRSETRALAVDGTGVHGVAADGSTWTVTPASAAVAVTPPDAAGIRLGPQRVQSLVATATHVDVGGTFSATRHPLPAGARQTRPVPGEPKALVVVDDTTYLAMYPVGELWAWPRAADRPTPVLRWRPDQIRPLDMVWVPATGRLAVATTDDAGTPMVHLIDPVSRAVHEVADPLDGGGLAGLAVTGDVILVGGSGPTAALGAIDAGSGTVRWVVRDAIPGGGFALGLQPVDDRLVAVSTRGHAVTLDRRTRQVTAARQVAPSAGRLRRADDRLLLATGDAVLALDPATLTTTTLVDGLAGAFWGWPSLAVGPAETWVIAGRRLARLVDRDSVPPPPPPAEG